VVLSYRGELTQPLNVVPAGRAGKRIGLRFLGPSVAALGQISRYLADIHRRGTPRPAGWGWEPIADKTRLLFFCRSMVGNHICARVETPFGQPLGRAWLKAGRPRNDRLTLDWLWEQPEDRPPIQAPFYLYFEGFNAYYRLRAEEVLPNGELVRTVGPQVIHRVQQRRFPRCVPSWPVEVSFEHPLIPGKRLDKVLCDLSYDGLGFEVDVTRDLLAHEMHLPDMRLTLPGGRRLRATGQVSHNYERRRDGRVLCGIHLDWMSRDQRRRWQDLVHHQLFPSIHPASRTDLEQMWDHYTESGYFSLSGKRREDFLLQQQPFVDLWSRINRTRKAGQLAVWRQDDQVLGTISTARIYSRTMIFQGLAIRDPAAGKKLPKMRVSRDLYLAMFEEALRDPTVRYVLAYLCLGSARRWHELLHHRFEDSRPQHVVSMKFWLLEGRCDAAIPEPETGIVVEPATWEDSIWLLERLEASSPQHMLQALDLFPEQLPLTRANRLVASEGYRRRRRLLTARRGRQRLAMAIVESASEGLNPFRLFDSVRIVDTWHEGSNEAVVQLLNAARGHYRQLGKPRCVCFADDDLVPLAEQAGFARIDEGLCWVIHRDALGSFLSHIYETLAPV
jgi:hypothetical protein